MSTDLMHTQQSLCPPPSLRMTHACQQLPFSSLASISSSNMQHPAQQSVSVIYHGTFGPPHQGHMMCLKSALDYLHNVNIRVAKKKYSCDGNDYNCNSPQKCN
eukprot:1766385-Amphidinium_carterae.1